MLDFDFKLLAIFAEIYKTKSVSHAAENLRIAQPTVSMGLRKLRERFNDPLFTRTSIGMEPTPRAEELWRPLTDALDTMQRALRHQPIFDPATADRCFRLCMTDISQIVLLPTLLNYYRTAAPSMRIEVIPIAADTPLQLESAGADLAIGFMPQLEAGFFQQVLFSQSFVCIVRADHPRIRKSLTLNAFSDEQHVEVTTTGTGHWIINKTLEEERVQRRVALKIPNFLGMAAIVESTDLIGTIPQRLATVFAKSANIRVMKPPIAFPSYAVKQHWHERFNRDPRNKWLRESVAALFLERRREVARRV